MHPMAMPHTAALALPVLALPGMFRKAARKSGACTEGDWRKREERVPKRQNAEEERRRILGAPSPAYGRKALARRPACAHGAAGSRLEFKTFGQLSSPAKGRGRPMAFGKMCCAMYMYTTVLVSIGCIIEGDNSEAGRLCIESKRSNLRGSLALSLLVVSIID